VNLFQTASWNTQVALNSTPDWSVAGPQIVVHIDSPTQSVFLMGNAVLETDTAGTHTIDLGISYSAGLVFETPTSSATITYTDSTTDPHIGSYAYNTVITGLAAGDYVFSMVYITSDTDFKANPGSNLSLIVSAPSLVV
jgi:hypothetical protein